MLTLRLCTGRGRSSHQPPLPVAPAFPAWADWIAGACAALGRLCLPKSMFQREGKWPPHSNMGSLFSCLRDFASGRWLLGTDLMENKAVGRSPFLSANFLHRISAESLIHTTLSQEEVAAEERGSPGHFPPGSGDMLWPHEQSWRPHCRAWRGSTGKAEQGLRRGC